MLFHTSHTALYAAFDIFPSYKGAATHIAHFSAALFEFAQNGWLHVLGDGEMPTYQAEENIEITRYQENIANYLERANSYGKDLYTLLPYQAKSLQICHFRDIWSALPILAYQETQPTNYQTLFEVNSLPSIELPYRYALPPATIRKLQSLEKYCLTTSKQVIVPSKNIAQFLVNQGVNKQKIKVIYNGATLYNPAELVVNTNEETTDNLLLDKTLWELPTLPYCIYVGTLQSWQGVEVLLRAWALLPLTTQIQLVICCSLKEKMCRPLQRLAAKLGIADRIIWKYRLSKPVLQHYVAHALFSVAPLTACTRNLQQGCCPLKILESMACGVPVLASNLPVAEELISNRQSGWLIQPDRPSEWARAIQIAIESKPQLAEMGKKAYQTIAENFTWEQKKEELQKVYEQF